MRAISKRLADLGSRNPALVLDEMQNAPVAILELLRLVASSRFDGAKTFSILLLGTEDLLAQLSLAINESLRQRITCYCQLNTLDEEQTAAYVRHQLAEAGAHGDIFTPAAVKLLYDLTSGTCRLIDTLAIAALTEASNGNTPGPSVDIEHLHATKHRCMLPVLRPT